MKKLILFFSITFLVSCAPFVPVTNISKVPKSTLQNAYKIKIFTIDSNRPNIKIVEYFGSITAYSCKNMTWDPPASKGDALIQLRLKALKMGANGIIDVTFDGQGTDAFGTNCWESVQTSGIAVKFKMQ